MSTTTFSRSSTPDVPTACVLTVTRNDTAAVVVGPNQAMTLAAGIWSYGPFTDPAAGITYAVAMNWTYSDGTTGGTTYVAGPTGGVAGIYASQADLEARYGSTNVAAWSALDGVAGANVGRIQNELTYADNAIKDAFRLSPYDPPPVTPITTRWAVAIAGESLYANRGQQTEGGGANQYAAEVREVKREMGLYRAGIRFFATGRATGCPSGPVMMSI